MSKVQMLRDFVNQRLTAAAEEIFGLFERTLAEYEEEVGRQRRLLQEAGHTETHGGTAVFPTNVKKFTVIKEVPVPVQEHWSPGPDQQDPKPAHVKEEQEELWTSQEGEQLRGLEEAHVKIPFTSVSVKGEDDDDGEEKAQSSRLHQNQTEDNRAAERLKTEADGEDHGGSGPARDSDPHGHLRPHSDKTLNSSETEDSSDGFNQSREPRFGSQALKHNEVHVSDVGNHPARNCFSCSGCGKRLGGNERLQTHMKCHAGEKTFTCPFCGKKFTKSSNLTTHLRVHTGEKPFTCSVCNTSFSLRCTLVNHMRVHTGEKPFSCSVCSKRFSKKANLTTHMALHTEEKPFKCSVCDKRFTWHSQVRNHKCAVDGSR